MNQEKIGNFIQEKRKEKKLTQSDLAEKLGVSNKAVSKWENGLNMPDLSLFKPLCEILDISINELMSGEKINDEEYQKKLEENIINITEYKKKQSDIMGYIIFSVIGIICLIFGLSFHQTVNNFSSLFELFGSALIIIAFLKLTRSLKLIAKIIVNLAVIIILIFVIRLFEVMNIEGEFNPPKYYYYKTDVGRCVMYKKLWAVEESYHDRDTFKPINIKRHKLYYIDDQLFTLRVWSLSYGISEDQLIEDVCVNNMNDKELFEKYGSLE